MRRQASAEATRSTGTTTKTKLNMKVAIIKYNAGNIYSVYCCVTRLGAEAVITDDVEEIRSADKVIFPGVGEARAAMEYLNEKGLSDVIRGLKQPVLGICIGMQLLCKHSEEGDIDCLGIFDVPVVKFRPDDKTLKVPQVGWNQISAFGNSPLYRNIAEGEYVYYVHSYHVPLCEWTIAKTDYVGPYSASLHKDNFWATQYHPEKSGSIGEQIIRNFLAL